MVIRKIINSTQKILTTSFKNLKRVLTGEEKILVLSFKSLLTSFTFLVLCFSINIFSFDNVFAEDLDYNITIQPSLNLTTSATDIKLNLNPATNPFASENLTVSVGTNNETGYKLYISSINNTTNLIEENDNNLYIETLSEESDESSFPNNRWGYKLNSTNDKYIPFTTGNILVSSSDKATNNISKTLTFAAKAGYETKPGTYNLALKFEAIANPPIYNIQDFTKELCEQYASENSFTVIDARDNNSYKVRYINGNCWMVQNLRYVGDSGSPANQMIIKSATTNVSTDTAISYTDLTQGDTYDAARLHVATDDQVPEGATYTATDMGVWYNYAAASAMTITGSSNTNTQTNDACPRNWRLPTYSEQSGITGYPPTFSPITGGYYYSGLLDMATYGFWWSATLTSYNYAGRYRLYWDGGSLDTNNDGSNRRAGYYVRCIRSN